MEAKQMAKVSAQTAYDAACSEYERGKMLVRDLTTLAQSVAKGFSFEIAMREYDYLLQGILLNVAMADGYFVENEKIFIRDIAGHGDILGKLNNEMRKHEPKWINLSWDDLTVVSDKTRKLISAGALLILNEAVDDFIEPFAIIDAVTATNYYQEFKEIFTKIILCLSAVDGDDAGSDDVLKEVNIGLNAFKLYFENKWLKIKEKKS